MQGTGCPSPSRSALSQPSRRVAYTTPPRCGTQVSQALSRAPSAPGSCGARQQTNTSGSNLTFESRLGFPSDLPNVVVGLQAAVSRFVAEANDDPKPFASLTDPNKGIVAVRRGYQVLD